MINKTKKYVGTGLILGTGATVLGAMGQGQIATKVITPASNMMGVMATADYGMQVMNMVNKKTKRRKYKWNTANQESTWEKHQE